MNSRILKKLCKRAANHKSAFKYLEIITEGNDPVKHRGFDRKHLERWQGSSNKHGYISFFRNTISFGASSGYYEPEWEDRPAYFILKDLYCESMTDWNEDGPIYTGVTCRKLTPSFIFDYFGL